MTPRTPPTVTNRVLLVEDNVDLALGLHNNLEIEGYAVETVHSGETALARLETSPNLVILDLMLPGISGMDVLQESRKRGFEGPVLILTARGEEADKVRGLRLGADDYLTKPFGLLELLARVDALLRRSRRVPRKPHETLRLGDLEVRTAQRQALRDGKALDLAPKEYDLLLALLVADGAVVSRRELLDRVWGYRENIYTRTVDTHIAELRRKVEIDPKDPRYILTVRKAGYRAGS